MPSCSRRTPLASFASEVILTATASIRESSLNTCSVYEQNALPVLREGIAHCEIVRDFVTRNLFSEILEAEEGHVDFIETQLDLISKIGIENYIQLQSGHAE